jgi:tRNA-specific 2-thiouridylase
MSGGVDSSVAAHLLQQQGYAVEGLFMFNWDSSDAYCTAAEDFQDARRVCAELAIPLHRADFSRDYRERVFQYFLDEYAAGRTPNPDVLCNREIKFDRFLDYARRLGADYIATGHYAGVGRSGPVPRLLRAADRSKDQSYFLATVPARALGCTLFPLARLEKRQVRALASRLGFANHGKKDSMGICFIGERDFTEFLSRYLPAQPGHIRTLDGRLAGRHQGLMFHTLGQRRGLGIGGVEGAANAPWYVVDKTLADNTLWVAQDPRHPLLMHDGLDTGPVHWIAGPPAMPLRCTAKVRYRQADAACTVTRAGSGCRVAFDAPVRAITPGQYVVFYAGETCLGGAAINRPAPAAAKLEAVGL